MYRATARGSSVLGGIHFAPTPPTGPRTRAICRVGEITIVGTSLGMAPGGLAPRSGEGEP